MMFANSYIHMIWRLENPRDIYRWNYLFLEYHILIKLIFNILYIYIFFLNLYQINSEMNIKFHQTNIK